MCFIFLIIMVSVSYYVDDESVVKISSFFSDVQSIKIICKEGYESGDVINGDCIIKSIDNYDSLNNYNYIGITFECGADFDVNHFIRKLKVHIKRKYMINDSWVMEGKLDHMIDLNFQTVQIVQCQDRVVIGFPMILNSF